MISPEGWRIDVEALIHEGFHRVDTGRANESTAFVTPDFTLVLPNATVPYAQYIELMERRASADYTTRHCVSNLRLVRRDADAVTVAFIVTAHRLSAGATATVVNVADMVDDWRVVDGEWKLASRSIEPTFPVNV